MKVKQRYVVVFILLYSLSVIGLYQFHKNSSIKMVPFTITSEEEMVIDFESLFNPSQVSESLTVGFKLDFIQKPLPLPVADLRYVVPSDEKWEERSIVFRDLFNIMRKNSENKTLDDEIINEKISTYIEAYKNLGYVFDTNGILDIADISYFGTYEIYIADENLAYEQISICRVFESEKGNYRVVIVNNNLDESYDIIFDENQDLIVNYLYNYNELGLEAIRLSYLERIEEQIYSSIVEMVTSKKDRLDIINKRERFILLRQENIIG